MLKTEFLGTCHNNKFCVEGVDLFGCKWEHTGECVTVLHPKTKKAYTFSVFKADIGSDVIIFATGEFDKETQAFFLVK